MKSLRLLAAFIAAFLLMGCGGGEKNRSLAALVSPCTGASPNFVAPTWADLPACIASANENDTITVMAGSYVMTTQTVINKAVRIVPGGVVNLTDNVCAGSCFSGAGDSSILIQTSSGNTQLGAMAIPCDSSSSSGCGGFNFVAGTSIHGNPSATIYVQGSGSGTALILGNTIPVNRDQFIHIQATHAVIAGNHAEGPTPSMPACFPTGSFLRSGGDGSGWSEVSKFGSLDTDGNYKIYIENNWFKNVGETIDANDGNRMVIRNNTFINSAHITHGSDTQAYGGRYVETYRNSFIRDNSLICGGFDTNTNGFIGIRGGGAMIFANAIGSANTVVWGAKPAIQIASEQIWRNAGPYACWGTPLNPSKYAGAPIPSQAGWGWISGATQAGNTSRFTDLEPIYFAGNTGAGNYENPSVITYEGANECGSTQTVANYVHNDVEYYKQVPLTSFTGTSGASQGARSQRPSSTRNGVAFWSTDQGGDWDTVNGSANDGCLDRIVGGVWVNCWYTPYIYPHPLTTGTQPPPPTPTAPTITMQPSNSTVLLGQAATFTVGATGNPAPTYQWRRASAAISGATSSIYTMPATVSGDSGAVFDVVVTNFVGSITSASATLTLTTTPPPTDTTPPTAPTNLTTMPVSTSQINLAWMASTDAVGVTGYRLERCLGAGCKFFAQVATPILTGYNDTGLAIGSTYTYRVLATDAAGNLSNYSNVVPGTTLGQSSPCVSNPLTFSVSRWPQSDSGNNRQLTYSTNHPIRVTFDLLVTHWQATAVDAAGCTVTVTKP